MSDLFREAEDELRKETATNVIKRLAPFIIGAAVVALAAGAGWQWYQADKVKDTETAATSYDAAMGKLQAGDLAGGESALAAIAKLAPDGYAAQAILQRGAVLQEQGKSAEARAIFEEAANSIQDDDLADLARLRAAYIAADSETRDQLNARLTPIIERKGAFAPLARELLAARAWEAGDKTAARAAYIVLQLDINAPEGVRARAGQAIAVIDAAATKSKTPMEIQAQPGQDGQGAPGGQPTPEQMAQMQAQQMQAQQSQVQGQPPEVTPDAPRIVRLPPGVKLPPGFKVPPNVRVIETPLPAGARPPTGSNPNQQNVPSDVLAEIERERQASMARQKATTEAQQRQINEIERARVAASAAPKSTPSPVPSPTKAEEAPTTPKQNEPPATLPPVEAPKSGEGPRP